jgi:hypothetical protein
MSLAVMGWAWKQPVDPPARKLVLMALSDMAQDCGHTWPTVPTIGAMVRLKDRQVFNHIRELEASGYLTVEAQIRPGKGKVASTYLVHWSADAICTQVHRGHAPEYMRDMHLSAGPIKELNRKENRKSEPATQQPLPENRQIAYGSEFEAFWEAWPKHKRKTDKKGTLDSFTRRMAEGPPTDILPILEAWKISEDWTKDGGDFIPAPKVWLNQRKYEVDITTLKAGNNGTGSTQASVGGSALHSSHRLSGPERPRGADVYIPGQNPV